MTTGDGMNKTNEFANLIGSMSLLDDGVPVDIQMWKYWEASFKKIVATIENADSKKPINPLNQLIDIKSAFLVTYDFLDEYTGDSNCKSRQAKDLLCSMLFLDNGMPSSSLTWKQWELSYQQALDPESAKKAKLVLYKKPFYKFW